MSSPNAWIVAETMIQRAIDQRPTTNPLNAIAVLERMLEHVRAGGELVGMLWGKPIPAAFVEDAIQALRSDAPRVVPRRV